jgi:hypothetical protein
MSPLVGGWNVHAAAEQVADTKVPNWQVDKPLAVNPMSQTGSQVSPWKSFAGQFPKVPFKGFVALQVAGTHVAGIKRPIWQKDGPLAL